MCLIVEMDFLCYVVMVVFYFGGGWWVVFGVFVVWDFGNVVYGVVFEML